MLLIVRMVRVEIMRDMTCVAAPDNCFADEPNNVLAP